MPLFRFSLFGQLVLVACETDEPAALLDAVYGAFACPDEPAAPGDALAYTIGGSSAGGFLLQREGEAPVHAANDGMLLFHLEQDLTVELQKRRSDLYFLHAAALERDGRAVLLVAESGAGKSTTAWGLLHHGFRYASDELAPVDLSTGTVHGFPHALCLKAEPPAAYPLPVGVLRTSRTLHVPVHLLPSPLAPTPLPVHAIVFLRYHPRATGPSCVRSDPPRPRPVSTSRP